MFVPGFSGGRVKLKPSFSEALESLGSLDICFKYLVITLRVPI